LSEQQATHAFRLLARHRALNTLVRGGLPASTLRRLLKGAFPRNKAAELPPEVWSSLAVGIALESPLFSLALAEALQDHLAWDREPADMDAWWQAVRERPLEALWMAVLSDSKPVRKELAHLAEHCLENFRSSPACTPPSWDFVEGLLDVHARASRELRDAERTAEDAEHRLEAERGRSEELREELKRLRRETGELRSERARAERRAEAALEDMRRRSAADSLERLEELERRLRKAEKEREHLQRQLARTPATASLSVPAEDGPAAADGPEALPVAEPAPAVDANPRRRILRQLLRKLVQKGKIGASHTHEDNVYRGVADHEKGIAKELVELLYREGYLLPKPTLTDPHVSLRPERLAEVRAIVGGAIANPRLARFVES
jgi:hypothetical protein